MGMVVVVSTFYEWLPFMPWILWVRKIEQLELLDRKWNNSSYPDDGFTGRTGNVYLELYPIKINHAWIRKDMQRSNGFVMGVVFQELGPRANVFVTPPPRLQSGSWGSLLNITVDGFLQDAPGKTYHWMTEARCFSTISNTSCVANKGNQGICWFDSSVGNFI